MIFLQSRWICWGTPRNDFVHFFFVFLWPFYPYFDPFSIKKGTFFA